MALLTFPQLEGGKAIMAEATEGAAEDDQRWRTPRGTAQPPPRAGLPARNRIVCGVASAAVAAARGSDHEQDAAIRIQAMVRGKAGRWRATEVKAVRLLVTSYN